MRLVQQDTAAWWLAEKFENIDPGVVLGQHIARLKANQTSRYDNMKRCISSYEFGTKAANRDLTDDAPMRENTLSYNHARNTIDSIHAKLCKGRVLPMALTNGGGYLQRDRAKQLEKAIHGELRKNNIDELVEDVARDGLVCGIGWAHVLHGQKSLTIEWVPADDVLLDQAETRHKKPRSIFRRLFIDRYVLLEKYGKKGDTFYGTVANRVAKIRRARSGDVAWGTKDILSNQIEVWLGWHLRSDEDADDGKYAVIIDGCCLEFDDWERDTFPLVPYVPYPRMRQLHGISTMQDFMAPQQEHDKLTERLQRAMHLLGGSHILAPREANIDIRELNNGQGTVISYDASAGGPGSVTTFHPEIANEQTFRYREALIMEMMTSKGVPQMVATGNVPEGMQGASGKALQVAEEANAEKLLIPLRQKDRFIVNLSWRIVEEAEAMVENDSNYTVKSKGERRGLEKVQWSKVLMDREEFDLDLFPANALSKSPAALFQQLTELLSAKAITVEQFRRLFDLPDLEAENDVDMADIDVVDQTMDKIVIEGKPLLPTSFDYLQLIIQRGRKFYNMCVVKNVPEDRLALLRDYIERAQKLDMAQKAAAAPQNQGMAGAPSPAPMPSADAAVAPPPGPNGAPPVQTAAA